jgi:predicted nucleotidyltransferase
MVRIQIDDDALAEFCRRHRIKRLAFFGSVLREDFGPESDVDVLVEFEPDVSVGFFAIARMQDELTTMLGRSVDLRTPKGLSRYFRDQVVREAEAAYVA